MENMVSENKRTSVYISPEEMKLINENLKGTETLSDFVHNSVNELIDSRRREKGLVLVPQKQVVSE